MARPGAKAKISTDAYPQIAQLILSGVSHADIARVFSVHQSTITRLMPKLAMGGNPPVDNSTAESFVASHDKRLDALRAIHAEFMRTLDFDWRDAAMKAYRETFNA